jgi:hypothetical protein
MLKFIEYVAILTAGIANNSFPDVLKVPSVVPLTDLRIRANMQYTNGLLYLFKKRFGGFLGLAPAESTCQECIKAG